MTLKIYRKTAWITVQLTGAALVQLRQPSSPEWLELVRKVGGLDAAVTATAAAARGTLTQSVTIDIAGAEIEALCEALCRWTLDLVGVESDGEAVVWRDLDEAGRRALWEAVPLGDLTHAYACAKFGLAKGGAHLELARKIALLTEVPVTPATEPTAPSAPAAPKKPRAPRKKAAPRG